MYHPDFFSAPRKAMSSTSQLEPKEDVSAPKSETTADGNAPGSNSPEHSPKGPVSETGTTAEQRTEQTPMKAQTSHSASFKTAMQIALAADDMMMSLGQQTTDAVCQAVRAALDKLWNVMATREAAQALKDVPVGKPVKCGESIRFFGKFLILLPTSSYDRGKTKVNKEFSVNTCTSKAIIMCNI